MYEALKKFVIWRVFPKCLWHTQIDGWKCEGNCKKVFTARFVFSEFTSKIGQNIMKLLNNCNLQIDLFNPSSLCANLTLGFRDGICKFSDLRKGQENKFEWPFEFKLIYWISNKRSVLYFKAWRFIVLKQV